jgi:hypothetical protein
MGGLDASRRVSAAAAADVAAKNRSCSSGGRGRLHVEAAWHRTPATPAVTELVGAASVLLGLVLLMAPSSAA